MGPVDGFSLTNVTLSNQTMFITEASDKCYWANCAWDSLGVLVAIGATSGRVHATCAADHEALQIDVMAGAVVDTGAVAHVLVPLRHRNSSSVQAQGDDSDRCGQATATGQESLHAPRSLSPVTVTCLGPKDDRGPKAMSCSEHGLQALPFTPC